MEQKKTSKYINYIIFIKYRVNCFFYSKIGACRHGDKCNRIHNRPVVSPTILFKHLYQNPPEAIAFAEGNKVSDEALKSALDHFYKFYEEIFIELSNFGELKELNVCDNLGDHMIGNVYAKFSDEEGASKAYSALAGKYYHSNLVQEEYSPVVNFRECRCRNYEEDKCERGGFCNFLHLKHVSHSLIRSLMDEMYDKHPEYRKNKKRSFSRKRKYRKHEHSSSESSLDGYDNYHRKKIIKKWCIKYQRDKELEEKKKETAQAKINLALIEQKLSQTTKKAEDLIQQQNEGKEYIYPKDNLNLIEEKNKLFENNNNSSKEKPNDINNTKTINNN